jgi:hypothetical protein
VEQPKTDTTLRLAFTNQHPNTWKTIYKIIVANF